MPLFSRFKNKGSQPTSKSRAQADYGNGNTLAPVKPKWQADWNSKVVDPEEVAELVHVCTAEMKARAEALDSPFLLLPFRPNTDPQGARTFIRNFYKANAERSPKYTGIALQQELRLTEPIVLCSIMKWCWSRMPNGVVSWPVYEGFRIGERESQMARNAFSTFIPISADSEAHKNIILDFFDLISAVAAHGKLNGLTGRKLSRLAGWWAFEHTDDGKGFEGGYKSWTVAADATSHLFFAYLRSLSPDTDPSMNVIERIPRSLQALLASTEYPPETPTLMQRSTPRVMMVVDTVSPTPFALLRRAKNFEYRDNDNILREYSEFEDPLDALTDECKRVLYAISTTNQSTAARSKHGNTAKTDESWSAFQNMGFSDIDDKALSPRSTKTTASTLRSEPQSRNADHARPTTPSWADFLSSGFADDEGAKSPTLLYPPAQILPPLRNRTQPPMYMNGSEENLAPGELAAITNVDLDDAFWWVWMTSLAGEETSDRKAVFGRCALVETTIMNGRWLIMEEQVKGASPDPAEGAYIAPKKSIFSFTKRGRLGRKRSTTKPSMADDRPMTILSATPSRTSIAPDQHAKIKAAAAALTRKSDTPDTDVASRRGRYDEAATHKTNSVLTLGLQSEAGPAMKFINAYDKNAIRAQYLGDNFAGTGKPRTISSTTNLNEEPSGAAAQNEGPAPVIAPSTPVHHQESMAPAAATPAPADSVQEPRTEGTAFESEALTALPSAKPASVATYQPSHGPDSALEKDISVEEPSSPTSNYSARKPLPVPEHPAYRPPPAEEKPVTQAQNPAALAAARAMQTSGNQEAQRNLNTKKSNIGGGGLKKFFGKKKETSGTGRGDSLDLIRPNGGAQSSTNHSINRRLSLMRRKDQHTSKDSFAAIQEPVATDSVVGDGPSIPTYVPTHEPSAAHLSRVNTIEKQDAETEFARFDQGPIADMPATDPIDSEDEASPELRSHKFEAPAPVPKMPEPEDKPPIERKAPASMVMHQPPIDDNASESSMDEPRQPAISHDRWATIRENAAKRAQRVDERPSEETSNRSRFSQSMRTDDGETSGEETIESRVARIKARVAELTGNMDSASRR